MSSPPPPFVTLENVSIRAGERRLFENTSLCIRTGEHWGIVGPNGSGKSILAGALCGQANVVAGRVGYHFLSAEALPDARFGVFPKGTVVRVSSDDYRELAGRYGAYCQARWHASELGGDSATVADLCTRSSVEAKNPFEVLAPEGDPGDFEGRRARAIEMFGLERLLGRRVGQLSHGETRKLVLARAVMRAPRLLVLDEPFAGLDVGSRRSLRRSLDALGREGIQLVVVAARPEELPSCVTRLARVEEHRLLGVEERHAPEEDLDEPGVVAPNVRDGASDSAGGGRVLVEMNDVTVRYGTATILEGVSFRVRAGEHWALLGPNGSGKTTLLSLISADNPQAYANDIAILGRRRGPGESIWETKTHVGMASPELHAHTPPHLSALEVVCSGFFASIGLFAATSAAQLASARRLLDELAPGSAERAFGELSYGLQRRVAVARALVADPELLLLDEPCHGLDDAARRQVLFAIDRAVHVRMASVIFVTHEPRELPRCISHVLELDAGRVARSGRISATRA